MTKAVLGIIGGSGLYDLPGLQNVREERIASPGRAFLSLAHRRHRRAADRLPVAAR